MPTAMMALIAVCPTRMMRFCSVKKAGVSTQKTPIRTKSAINARKRNSRTPNESPNALERTGGAGGAGEAMVLIEKFFLVNWFDRREQDARSVCAHPQPGPTLPRLTHRAGIRRLFSLLRGRFPGPES